jgi:hypothetical protein
MTRRLIPLLVVVAALAALAGTISYAVARANNGGNHNYGSMMNGAGYTMMGGSAGRSANWYLNGSAPITTIPAARVQAQKFADRLGLKTAEVIQFSDNFYVRLDDAQGNAATEVLVDPQSGAVTLEYGPAMMWNTRYGMMGRTGTSGYGGMMGSGSSGGMTGGSGSGMMSSSGTSGMMGGMMGHYGGSPTWTPTGITGPVAAALAKELANRWLAQERTGQSAGTPDALPGYYTMETLANGKIAGMISVNKATGAVWFHWWHGRFVALAE